MKTPPLKWHGGKKYLRKWIIGLMPPRCKTPNDPWPGDRGWLHYVETHFGGGRVAFELDPNGISMVANDLNNQLVNFYRVIRDKDAFEEFQRTIQLTKFAQAEWEAAGTRLLLDEMDVEHAVKFFVYNRQSLAGRMNTFATLSNGRTRCGMNEQLAAWLGAIEGLPEVHLALQPFVVLSDDAVDVIHTQDGPRTLFYLDPPYMKSSRKTTEDFGAFEMNDRQHAILLAALSNPGKKQSPPLNSVAFNDLDGDVHGPRRATYGAFLDAWYRPLRGRFLLSGYRTDLYDLFAKVNKWKRHDKKIDNKAAGGKTKRIMTESVWCNYAKAS